ncbi:hypothetical protein D3C81_1953740 [compost metagenome]
MNIQIRFRRFGCHGIRRQLHVMQITYFRLRLILHALIIKNRVIEKGPARVPFIVKLVHNHFNLKILIFQSFQQVCPYFL